MRQGGDEGEVGRHPTGSDLFELASMNLIHPKARAQEHVFRGDGNGKIGHLLLLVSMGAVEVRL